MLSPDRRPQHARELVEALEMVATPAPVSIGAFSFLARCGVLLTGVITVSIAVIAYPLAVRLGTGAAATNERSIAVIPLVNIEDSLVARVRIAASVVRQQLDRICVAGRRAGRDQVIGWRQMAGDDSSILDG